MTRVLHELTQEGYTVDEDAVAALSPYQTEHINRFGRYHQDLSCTPAPIDYDTPILSTGHRTRRFRQLLPAQAGEYNLPTNVTCE